MLIGLEKGIPKDTNSLLKFRLLLLPEGRERPMTDKTADRQFNTLSLGKNQKRTINHGRSV